MATSISLQALLRASRTPTPAARPGRSARPGKPSPQDKETAAALYEQLAFDGVTGEDQDDEQEQGFVISLERQARLEELKRRVGELARDDPKTKPRKMGRGDA